MMVSVELRPPTGLAILPFFDAVSLQPSQCKFGCGARCDWVNSEPGMSQPSS